MISLPERTAYRNSGALSQTDRDDSLIARGLAALRSNQDFFTESLYQSARQQFLEMARPYLLGNHSYNDFVRVFFQQAIEKFGDGVKPHAIRFCKECEPQFKQRDSAQQQRRKPANLAGSSDRARLDERYRKARTTFDRETMFGNWQLTNAAIASALATFRQLADDDYEPAYYPLSILLRAERRGDGGGNRAQHFAKRAFDWAMAHQDREDPALLCDLGDMYKNGHGTAQDAQQAERCYRKAAERGYARGQWALGLCCYDGENLDSERNVEALKWMGQAAAQGEAFLQCWLGDVYQMHQRYEDALHWYGQAAAQDDKEGLFKLGTMYEQGHGVPHDNDAAAFWYRKAAKQGHAEAQWQLSQLQESDGY